MPAVKSSPLTIGTKSAFSPYSLTHPGSRTHRAPFVRVYTPPFDDACSSPEFLTYDDYDDAHIALTQWMNAGSLFTDSDSYGSASPCPPSFTPSPLSEDNLTFDEPLEGELFSWPYAGHGAGYDASYPSYPSPSISIAPCSPRSENSVLSLSPQPQFAGHSDAYIFNFETSLPNEFPSSPSWSPASLSISHSPLSALSHSPSPSCSSVDPVDIKTSPSREASPSRTELDAQQQRRRFPCLILGCERRFTSQYTLKVHMEAHKPKPRSSFPCTLGCSERFSRQHDRLRHEVAKHGKVCEFSCEECRRFFSTKKTLGNHKCPVAQGGTRWVNS